MRPVYRERAIGEADAASLDECHQLDGRAALVDAELCCVELGNEIVHVEHDLGAQQLRQRRGRDEVVRHRVHMDDVVPVPEMQSHGGESRAHDECDVTIDVGQGAQLVLHLERPSSMDVERLRSTAARRGTVSTGRSRPRSSRVQRALLPRGEHACPRGSS